MKKYKHGYLIGFVLIFLMNGCAQKNPISAEENGEIQTASDTNYGYYYQKSPLPGDMAFAVSQFAAGTDIYLCGMDKHSVPLLCRYDGETVLDYALPDDIEYAQRLAALQRPV